jgi:hypothetical protein
MGKNKLLPSIFQRTKVSMIVVSLLIGIGYYTIEQPRTVSAMAHKQPAVEIISVTSPAPRNGYATLKAKVAPNASASIVVEYKSGPSHAQGLGSKKANSKGYVSWTWKVGGRTTLGKWPITITSNGKRITTSFEVVH